MQNDISERISILRILLIYGIIVLHVPPYIPITETGDSIFDLFKAVMQHAIFRCSVPVLTFISGYLLFTFNMDQSFKTLVIKKTKTILIPLLVFNIPVALAVCAVQANDLLQHSFSGQLYPFNLYHWVNAITGLFGGTINYPLSFLRDLYVISIAAPLFGFFLRRYPWVGLAIVFLVFWNDLDGKSVLRNIMPINFYMGGMAAIITVNLRKFDTYAPYLFLTFVVICIIVVLLPIPNRNYLRLVAPIFVWPAASILVGTNFGKFLSKCSRYSFAIFLLHGPLLLVAWIAYQKFFQFIPYPLFWMLIPVAISSFVSFSHPHFYRWFPRATSFALGGR